MTESNSTNDTYKWIKVTNKAEFAPRDGAGALVFKEKMWLLGGWRPKKYDKVNFPRDCNNEVWSSKDGVIWSLEKPNTFLDKSFDTELDWEGTHTAGYVIFNNKMWIIGGDPIQGHYQYDVWNSVDGKNWVHVNKDQKVPWGPRILHYTLVFNDKIWIMGGQTTPQFAPAEELFYNDIWNTQNGVNWTKLIPKKPLWPNRGMISGSVVFNDRMWVLGGGTYDTPGCPKRKFYNDVWSSPDGINWEKSINNAPWEPREYHSVAVFDGKMWIVGGRNNKDNINDVWYSSDGVGWYEVPNTPWNPKHAISIFVYNQAMWVVGGCMDTGPAAGSNMKSDVWKVIRI